MLRSRRRFRRKGRYGSQAALIAAALLVLAAAASQVPHYYYVWPWTADAGYRSAALQSGHYERRFPALSHAARYVGRVIAPAGDILLVDYDVALDGGRAELVVRRWPRFLYDAGNDARDGAQDAGRHIVKASEDGRMSLTLPAAGIYTIHIYTFRFEGEVAVDWRIDRRKAQVARSSAQE